ncbi:hypothetical protein G4V62_08880 [Bacillaceae bacterium SIJ1]|nr:hypothetical protein [Litoribacterium kuwaitense]
MTRIAIDMDEVMADTGMRLIELCNEHCQDEEPITPESLRGNKIYDVRPNFTEQLFVHLMIRHFSVISLSLKTARESLSDCTKSMKCLLRQPQWKSLHPLMRNTNG